MIPMGYITRNNSLIILQFLNYCQSKKEETKDFPLCKWLEGYWMLLRLRTESTYFTPITMTVTFLKC